MKWENHALLERKVRVEALVMNDIVLMTGFSKLQDGSEPKEDLEQFNRPTMSSSAYATVPEAPIGLKMGCSTECRSCDNRKDASTSAAKPEMAYSTGGF